MECKIIFKTYLARHLLLMGNPIVDIKPDKNNTTKTLFIFEETEKFKQDLTTLLSEG